MGFGGFLRIKFGGRNDRVPKYSEYDGHQKNQVARR